MDKLNSYYDQVKERLRSPLIFSFIISWLVINWRIPVYLLWFDEATLLKHGYSNHIVYIESVLGTWQCWVGPLICAVMYTIGYPQVKNLIGWYQAWVSKVGEKKRLEISDGAVVSFSRYDAKVKKLIQREKELAEMMQKEGETIQEFSNKNAQLSSEIVDLKRDLALVESKRNELHIRHNQALADLSFEQDAKSMVPFAGTWIVQIANEEVEWRIDGASVHELDEKLTTTQPHSVEFSYWNTKKDGRIVLMLHVNGNQKKWSTLFPKHRIYAYLRSNTEGTLLSGHTAEAFKITMRKIIKT